MTEYGYEPYAPSTEEAASVDPCLFIIPYFIEKGIRFIAIGDHVDSANGNYRLNLPILNIMNYEYAQNISEKTRDGKIIREL